MLEFLPDSILEWNEKALNSGIFRFFAEEQGVPVFFLEIFVFLCRYNLLSDTTRLRLYYLLIDILTKNIENSLRSEKKVKNFIVLKMDRVFEIIYYGLCYYNDKIVFSNLEKIF